MGRESPIAEELRPNAEQINQEFLDAQGSATDPGGYYWPDEEKTSAVMRPSATSLLSRLWAERVTPGSTRTFRAVSGTRSAWPD